MNVQASMEHEMRRRGLSFSIDSESGRYAVEIEGRRMLVCLDNLQRDVAGDGDTGRVSRFVDAMIASAGGRESALSKDHLYWSLEARSDTERPDLCVPVSDRVDRVLVHLSADGRLITWVTPPMLDALGLTPHDAGARAFLNLGRALNEATIESQVIDGVRLGFVATTLPFKAALLLSPNLRDVVGSKLGWPLLAVIPDRDFLCLWAARDSDFVQRIGSIVVREYSQASYPISTEVYEITDQKIRAIGEFPAVA